MTEEFLYRNKQHGEQCHRRWMEKRNRKQGEVGYKDEWYAEQCGRCTYFIPLSGVLQTDYGVCSNSISLFDATVRFEHDGCDGFAEAPSWVSNSVS